MTAHLEEESVRALGPGGALAQRYPGFQSREAQQAMARCIAQTMVDRGTLVGEAGTGTGKTFAYLVPALLSGLKVLISTATRPLQDQLFHRDLPALQAALGQPVQAVLLKGRSNYVCPHHLARHLAEIDPRNSTLASGLHLIDRFARGSRTGDRADCGDLPEDSPVWAWATSTRESCLGQDCPELDRCFVNRARREAMNADLVVINHALFCADLALREDALGALLPTADAVIFDEAHALADTALEYFGERVSTRQCLDWARDGIEVITREGLAGTGGRERVFAVEAATQALRQAFDAIEDRSTTHRGQPAGRSPSRRWGPDALRELRVLASTLDSLIQSLVAAAQWISAHAGRHPDLDRLGVRAADLGERLQRWEAARSGLGFDQADDSSDPDGVSVPPAKAAVVWAESGDRMVVLRRTPLSAAPTLVAQRGRVPAAWVLVSATLSIGEDFSHVTHALGLAAAHCERWESPFDFPRNGALWVPRELGSATDPGHAHRLVEAVWPLIRANQGRAFFLCTTLRAIRVIGAALADRNRGDDVGLTLLLQGDAPRQTLLGRFTREPRAVLVGSTSFWEGVDVPGDALSLVVIDKLPFAPPDDPVLKARDDACRRQGKDPFREHALPAAALALKQGAGRLIRSERDRGVLVIGDDRLIRRGYGKALLAALPPFSRVEDWRQALPFLPMPGSTLS